MEAITIFIASTVLPSGVSSDAPLEGEEATNHCRCLSDERDSEPLTLLTKRIQILKGVRETHQRSPKGSWPRFQLAGWEFQTKK